VTSPDREQQIRNECAALADMLVQKNAAIAGAGHGCRVHRGRRLKDGRCFACYQREWVAKQKWIAQTPGARDVVMQDLSARLEARRVKAREYQRELRRENPEEYRASEQARGKTPRRQRSHRARILRVKYGITREQYDLLCESQGGRCAVCTTTTPGGRGAWAVDHDHRTGKVRGLLCTKCNTGIGLFDDDPVRLRAAIKYLGGAK